MQRLKRISQDYSADVEIDVELKLSEAICPLSGSEKSKSRVNNVGTFCGSLFSLFKRLRPGHKLYLIPDETYYGKVFDER